MQNILKPSVKIGACLLLLINGIGAIYGGGNLVLHPDGSTIGLSLSLLAHTPFNDSLIPGIVLLAINGAFSFAVLAMTIASRSKYYLYVVMQGLVLLTWLAIQIMMIRVVDMMHVVMLTVGGLLVIAGFGLGFLTNPTTHRHPVLS